MKIQLHYAYNEAMRPLVERYFLSYIPSGFQSIEHLVGISTSGNFLKDNYGKVIIERLRLIIAAIEHCLDGGVMFWCDVDVIFFSDCSRELELLSEKNDLVLQRENSEGGDANFGLQLIRRNLKTLKFYSRLLELQSTNNTENIQTQGNDLIRLEQDIKWSLLPLKFSSESNGGCKTDSVLYHANCTPVNSMEKKTAQLEAALIHRRYGFEGFRCKKKGQLSVEYFKGYETRNESTVRLINLAIQRYNLGDFDWIYVHSGDREIPSEYNGKRAFCYATKSEFYDNVCPDYVFDHWRQTQLNDYESIINEIASAGNRAPETDMIGWRGNVTTHPNRMNIIKFDNKVLFDMEGIQWNRSDPNCLTCPNFISLPDQARKWRFFLDVEGDGWSTRLKVFLFSKRVVFLQDRPYKEWYFPFLKPWEHYVPVRRDLADLTDKLNVIKHNVELENAIRRNAYSFACKHLTRAAALERWRYLLTM